MQKHDTKGFKVGDKIDVIVTSFDKNKKRYSLIAK